VILAACVALPCLPDSWLSGGAGAGAGQILRLSDPDVESRVRNGMLWKEMSLLITNGCSPRARARAIDVPLIRTS
jgi:hypothetical protein